MPTDGQGRLCILGSYAKALVVTADRIPVTGETLAGRNYRQTFGGKGSDMAVQAARLGAEVDFLGVVGDDHFGHEFLSLMQTEGISTERILVDSTTSTGVGLIIKDEEGNNVIVVDDGANASFSTDYVETHAATIRSAAVVLAQLEIPFESAVAGLATGAAAGALTILNPAPAVRLSPATDLSAVGIITPNQSEARVLVGEAPDSELPNSEVVQRLRKLGANAVVITMGEEGVDVFDGDEYVHVAPLHIDVIDSNGAGDSFNAALAVALCEGRSLTDAVRFANGTAALSCTGWETVPSYKRREDVDAFMAASLTGGY
ncbi:ribokinase [Paenarthrobacter sp. FR1]|uniref:ribokinase n=1 Tax=Paenarthrobacter sp. FR1 TaxID=3439548 RepID=UPI003DA628F6